MLRRIILSTPRRSRPPVATLSRAHRTYSTEGRRPSKEEINAAAIQHQLSGHAETAFRTMARFGKATVIASVLVGLTIFGSFELAHQYVEYRSLHPEVDEETRKYEWDVSDVLYHGDPLVRGTDPGLGREGRQAVRSAWMAQNWGVESPELGVSSISSAVDAPILYAVAYLDRALALSDNAGVHPLTRAELHNRAATLLERLGTSHIAEAKAHFEQAWRGFSGEGLRAARVALKLGNVSVRMGQNDEALHWWKQAIQLCEGPASSVGPLLEPKEVPTSPWAQRIVASALVAISAFYAQHGRLADAEKFQGSSLSLLRSIPTPESISTASPPQALHALFLLQRSSLLSVHLAEVLHAQKKPSLTSIQYLSLAATSSERVARALSNLPVQQVPGQLHEAPIPQGEDQIAPAYSASAILNPVASRLYRDAKRTAAEAWNLLGILYEKHEGKTSKTALLCYERAIQWAGKKGEGVDGAPNANEAITEADWSVFYANFQRAKEASGQKSKQ